jgi:magnesium chelatase subunit D
MPMPEKLRSKKKIAAEEGARQETDLKDIQPSPQNIFETQNTPWWDGGQKIQTGESFMPRRLDTPLDHMVRRSTGRRSYTQTDQKRGRYVQSRPANGKVYDLAFDATLRAAAPFQKQRRSKAGKDPKVAFFIRPNDYMRKVRVRRAANLVLFLVDASWSMAVTERMEATKGAILSLLTDAYQRRDRVGLIVFQKDRATLVLPPTNSVQLAHRVLADIPVGGKTPLSHGLQMAYDVLHREKFLHPDVMPLLIVLTDGAGNVSLTGRPPQEEAHTLANLIAEEDIHSVLINMEHAAFDQGLAQSLADHLQAPCYSITDMRADKLLHTVQREISFMQEAA